MEEVDLSLLVAFAAPLLSSGLHGTPNHGLHYIVIQTARLVFVFVAWLDWTLITLVEFIGACFMALQASKRSNVDFFRCDLRSACMPSTREVTVLQK
jgi:hypothetical protein